jgi:formate dehydrogenase major subunit
VTDPEVKARFLEGWGAAIPETKGLDNHEMVEAIEHGKIKGLYVIGEDLITADANLGVVDAALRKVDFFVLQDIFFTKTAQYADVILPAAASLEKEGTFTSTERRIQRLYQVFKPLGDTRPDWQIIQDIANRLGARWNYTHPSQVMEEAAALCPLFAGVTYERLEGYKSLQWPVHKDGTDSPLLFTKEFPFPDGKAKFHPLEWIEPCEQADTEFDLHLNNGRVLEHFEVGNMTYRVKGCAELVPDAFVEVSPGTAAERGIKDGTLVELRSRHGSLQVRALVTDRVSEGQLYMGLNTHDYPVNRITGSHVDRATHTPNYKEAAVQMKVLGQQKSPLPLENSRFGKPTPQSGVEVERKWRRPDYRKPGGD